MGRQHSPDVGERVCRGVGDEARAHDGANTGYRSGKEQPPNVSPKHDEEEAAQSNGDEGVAQVAAPQ
jgi:hypothetical protein